MTSFTIARFTTILLQIMHGYAWGIHRNNLLPLASAELGFANGADGSETTVARFQSRSSTVFESALNSAPTLLARESIQFGHESIDALRTVTVQVSAPSLYFTSPFVPTGLQFSHESIGAPGKPIVPAPKSEPTSTSAPTPPASTQFAQSLGAPGEPLTETDSTPASSQFAHQSLGAPGEPLTDTDPTSTLILGSAPPPTSTSVDHASFGATGNPTSSASTSTSNLSVSQFAHSLGLPSMAPPSMLPTSSAPRYSMPTSFAPTSSSGTKNPNGGSGPAQWDQTHLIILGAVTVLLSNVH
ncbi:hypothetical protein K438DRAFT_1845588 [Mycena galopus ATCC 62051]|nr:hypothetical protein K438DRAFT_1845588 [Mycena galopus ATCC 62051]